MLIIHSNGSNWAGDDPADINSLLKALDKYTLDPKFEEYGNFIDTNPRKSRAISKGITGWVYEDEGPLYPDALESVGFFGNFFNVSHVFRLATDEPDLIKQLSDAIAKNKSSDDYRLAKEACKGST